MLLKQMKFILKKVIFDLTQKIDLLLKLKYFKMTSNGLKSNIQCFSVSFELKLIFWKKIQ